MKESGLIRISAPVTTEASEWPDQMLQQAWCKATKLAEQPVSIVILAPCKS